MKKYGNTIVNSYPIELCYCQTFWWLAHTNVTESRISLYRSQRTKEHKVCFAKLMCTTNNKSCYRGDLMNLSQIMKHNLQDSLERVI